MFQNFKSILGTSLFINLLKLINYLAN